MSKSEISFYTLLMLMLMGFSLICFSKHFSNYDVQKWENIIKKPLPGWRFWHRVVYIFGGTFFLFFSLAAILGYI